MWFEALSSLRMILDQSEVICLFLFTSKKRSSKKELLKENLTLTKSCPKIKQAPLKML